MPPIFLAVRGRYILSVSKSVQGLEFIVAITGTPTFELLAGMEDFDLNQADQEDGTYKVLISTDVAASSFSGAFARIYGPATAGAISGVVGSDIDGVGITGVSVTVS